MHGLFAFNLVLKLRHSTFNNRTFQSFTFNFSETPGIAYDTIVIEPAPAFGMKKVITGN